ncbi:hypothetical protein CPL00188L_CDS0070 [Escherichia phage WaterSpirit]
MRYCANSANRKKTSGKNLLKIMCLCSDSLKTSATRTGRERYTDKINIDTHEIALIMACN